MLERMTAADSLGSGASGASAAGRSVGRTAFGVERPAAELSAVASSTNSARLAWLLVGLLGWFAGWLVWL